MEMCQLASDCSSDISAVTRMTQGVSRVKFWGQRDETKGQQVQKPNSGPSKLGECVRETDAPDQLDSRAN